MTNRRNNAHTAPRKNPPDVVAEPIIEQARRIRALTQLPDTEGNLGAMTEIAALECEIAKLPASTLREGVVQAMLASALAERSLEDADDDEARRAAVRMLFLLSRSLLNLLLAESADLDPAAIGVQEYAADHTDPYPDRRLQALVRCAKGPRSPRRQP